MNSSKSQQDDVKNWYLRERVGHLIKGSGQYIDDIQLPNMLHCALLTSPYPHALIKNVNITKALSLPSVKKVLTGKELTTLMRPMPMSADYTELGLLWRNPQAYPLAVDRTRFFGEPVAAVTAEDKYTAVDALDLIQVEYEPLTPVTDIFTALRDSAPLLYPEWGDNIQCKFKFSTYNINETFSTADRIVKIKWKEARQSGFPIETRGTIASYDRSTDSYVIYSATQSPAVARHVIASILGIPVRKVKVSAPDIGGAFGNKINFSLDVIACIMSKLCNRPVKLIESRYQNFIMGPHQRDVFWDIDAAITSTGVILGLKGTLFIDLGVEGNVRGCGAPSIIPATLSSVGAYKIKAVEIEAYGVVTNKSFYDAYRGYGKDKGAKMIEKLIDRIAHVLGLPPEQVRFNNFIQKNEFPYTHITGYVYDSGNYAECLSRALQLLNVSEWRSRQVELRSKKEYIGIGMSLTLEPAAGAIPYSWYTGYESIRMRISEDGSVEIYSGWTEVGQGSIVTMAKIVAETLHVKLEDVKVYTGSSDFMGSGSWSSRGSVYCASVVARAANVMKNRLLRIAGHILECRPEDLEISESQIYVKEDQTRKISIRDLCRAIYFKGQQKTLSTQLMHEGIVPLDITVSWFSPLTAEKLVTYTTVSSSADACVVKVDTETGIIKILKYVSVHDCGRIIDHDMVEGQVHGGLVQSVGAALYEELAYAKDGVLLTNSFVDYLMPTAEEIDFKIISDYLETPSPFTELGSKGVGEAAAYSGAVTIANAVEDALRPFGVFVDSIPITPERVLRWINMRKKP